MITNIKKTSRKARKAKKISPFSPTTFYALVNLIPESIFKKLNSSEIAQLVSIFYNQKIHGENDLFATFAEIIERGMRGEEKQR